jgi:hypothetical protein
MNIKLFRSCALAAAFASMSLPAFAGTPEYVEYKDPGYSFQNSPFRVSVTLREGYDDNVRTTKNHKIESWFTSLFANITADLSNPRTQFSMGIGGGATYYYDVPGTDWDWNGKFRLALVHRINPRLTLNANSLLNYEVNPDFSEQVGATRADGQYLYTNSSIGVTYQWTQKFQTVTSYSFVSVNYEDSYDKRVNNRIENYFNQQFRFLMTPVTTLSADYRLGFVTFDSNSINDSISNYLLLGIEHTFSPKLNLSVRAGAEIRDSDAAGTKATPYAEGTLNYIYGLYSNIALTTRYGFEQNNLFLVDELRTFRLGLKATHGFTAKFSLFGAAYYLNNDYSGLAGYTENIVNGTLGLRYAITRNWSIETAYTYTRLLSSQAFREYSRNRAYIGGTFSF